MRYPSTPRAAATLALFLALVTGLAAAPNAAVAQQPDAKELVKQAHERQHDFELFRQSRIPVQQERTDVTCDAQIGRICIWYGGEDETDFPAEAPEVGMARKELLKTLARAQDVAPDQWILGQLVRYLAESGNYGQAESVARACGIPETWWCTSLVGYALHLQGRWVEAEAAFREAAANLPKKERDWATLKYITKDAAKKLDKLDPADRQKEWDLYWTLSDPLYLVPGNDRLTDHFARWVEAENERDAENPQAMLWDDDMAETTVRYGRLIGYSRTQAPQNMMRGGRFQLRDTRQINGHHNPKSRGYLFPEEYLESPSEIAPESWLTAPRVARTWYAPPYAPDFRGLESQVGRFRRADSMLVVGAYRRDDFDVGAMGPAPTTEPVAASPFGAGDQGRDDGVQAGLFLVPLDGGPLVDVRGKQADGVLTLEAAPGKYVSSLEVLDTLDHRAWRARQGVHQEPLVPGLVAVSDLLLLEPGTGLPDTFEEALPHVRKGVRVRQGERFTVIWEVYGLQVKDPARVSLGFTKGIPKFREKVGDFLGRLDPATPVQVSFEDTGTDAVQTLFRSVQIQLPELEPGEYTLHLKLELPGRAPAIASRPITVVGTEG